MTVLPPHNLTDAQQIARDFSSPTIETKNLNTLKPRSKGKPVTKQGDGAMPLPKSFAPSLLPRSMASNGVDSRLPVLSLPAEISFLGTFQQVRRSDAGTIFELCPYCS
ncbi:hypothetical protein AMAG_20234 [Allomyces macrogynus ATCC 38327]|uniref:Uncharacterized protein n=1 Tax=Allomyces macrogynus (strain ATCC 38327) TaxID=578462 RepID=A0A0L0T5Q8_ALLM3|nr:hypothetical protein AMAG_20234 [Allomyces macrogynus ATCC 38327]|eukprot:KNE70082.1 hypothetical protein AMAG_20234 [Allomyces macrogynus ATCC 38327]